MADYIKKIRTENGDLQIDYGALANLPQSDTTLTKSGSFADAKETGSRISSLTADMQTMNSIVAETFGQLQEALDELKDWVIGEEYITETELADKKYVTEDQLNENLDELDARGYVTATQLETKLNDLESRGYVTETQLKEDLLATADAPGVVKPGEGLTVFEDGTLHVDKHPLEDLSNIHVCDAMPDTSEIIDGQWYLIKVEE